MVKRLVKVKILKESVSGKGAFVENEHSIQAWVPKSRLKNYDSDDGCYEVDEVLFTDAALEHGKFISAGQEHIPIGKVDARSEHGVGITGRWWHFGAKRCDEKLVWLNAHQIIDGHILQWILRKKAEEMVQGASGVTGDVKGFIVELAGVKFDVIDKEPPDSRTAKV